MPAPRRDLERTRKDLEAWLAARAGTGVRVGELSGPGATGFSSDTLLFDATFRKDGRERREALVARLRPQGFAVFPEYDIARQFEIQRRLAGAGIPVAPMRWLEPDEHHLGTPFYVMGRVPGRIPSDNPPYHQGGWLTEVSPAERESVWWSALDVLARIHALDWRDLGLGFLDEAGDPLEAHLDWYQRYLAWMGGRRKPLLERALAWLRANRPRDEGRPVLCWGDSRIGNMIFRDGRCVAVLDWEMARLGSPELDLGWFLFLDHHHSVGVGAARLPGFPSREESAARYQAQSGRPLRHLAYYELFAAFRFGAIMARVAQQMIHYGMLPADTDFELDNPCSRLLAAMLEAQAAGGARV